MLFKQRSLYSLKLSVDLILLNISFFVSAVLAQSFNIFMGRAYMLVLMLILNFIWYFSSQVFDLYEDYNSGNLSYQFIKIIKNTLVNALTCVFFIFVVKEDLFTRNFIILNFLILSFLVLLRISVFKNVFAYFQSAGKHRRNIAIIGAGELGNRFLNMIESSPEYGYNFTGFIGTNNEQGDNIIGSVAQLDFLIRSHEIDEAVIALPNTDFPLIEDIIRICNKNAVRSFIIPDYFRFLSKKFRISQFGNIPIITVRNEPLEELHWRFVKRCLDLIIAFFVSVLLLSWLFPIIIILLKTTSKGPVFYLQDRIGLGGRIFKCFKFRTMYINSDAKQYTPTEKGDPRVTSLGRFLRKSNIDELPQIINVILGEMSIVGPRPHPLAFNRVYTEIVEDIKLRQLVKPGITGWAQIHGLRGDVADEKENGIRIKKRIEHDIWYIENWSIGLDIQIILLTGWQMLRGKTNGH